MGRSKHYSIDEKAQALVLLEAEDGNQSAVSRQTGISRKTLRLWEKQKDEIMASYEKAKKLSEQDDVSIEEAETTMEMAELGNNYQMVKKHMADNFSKITSKAQNIVWKKISTLDAKDAMWVASVGIDKLMKLRGEPDQIVEVRNVIVHMVVEKLVEAVDDGIINEAQAEKLGKKFDEIEEAEYEEV
jgi:transposase-like protein